jgi:hypothetical protein
VLPIVPSPMAWWGVRSFRPEFVLPVDQGGTTSGDKVGGLPSGLALDSWPRCAECDALMSFIAQFHHDPDRLDLGGPERVLTLWQCERDPGMCETWSSESGANAAFVVDRARAGHAQPVPDSTTLVYPELMVGGWSEGDDGVPEELYGSYFDSDRLFALGEEGWSRGGYDTHFGGVPAWVQSPDEAPGPPWHYVGQLDNNQHLAAAPDTRIPGPTFGDGGMAYLFLNRTSEPPTAAMFWQCG